jgi:hypothetical protein
MIECIPLTDFEHAAIHARKGIPFWVHDALALDFERAGIVLIKKAPEHANKMQPEHANKGESVAAGEEIPVFVSPAAPVSPQRPVLKLKRPADETKNYE